ncbi:uncharacterized protein LDX57_009380 [Aspergillus melleus]|uniref:uncharacterized protein n=1 Tax=Aspergillus melleus TaxID=138277 RepID=UPI001E8E8423|nr:uncharacterized protein LDX57_009380 [Aspergillus melleus]KAH8431725.1 hypothetical protein LDX57_009380 [Aspergillus melleus]
MRDFSLLSHSGLFDVSVPGSFTWTFGQLIALMYIFAAYQILSHFALQQSIKGLSYINSGDSLSISCIIRLYLTSIVI